MILKELGYANSFASLQKYKLKNRKKHSNRLSKCKLFKEQNDRIEEVITGKIHICLMSETKVEQSFLNQQFQLHGYMGKRCSEGTGTNMVVGYYFV